MSTLWLRCRLEPVSPRPYHSPPLPLSAPTFPCPYFPYRSPPLLPLPFPAPTSPTIPCPYFPYHSPPLPLPAPTFPCPYLFPPLLPHPYHSSPSMSRLRSTRHQGWGETGSSLVGCVASCKWLFINICYMHV